MTNIFISFFLLLPTRFTVMIKCHQSFFISLISTHWQMKTVLFRLLDLSINFCIIWLKIDLCDRQCDAYEMKFVADVLVVNFYGRYHSPNTKHWMLLINWNKAANVDFVKNKPSQMINKICIHIIHMSHEPHLSIVHGSWCSFSFSDSIRFKLFSSFFFSRFFFLQFLNFSQNPWIFHLQKTQCVFIISKFKWAIKNHETYWVIKQKRNPFEAVRESFIKMRWKKILIYDWFYRCSVSAKV